VIPGFILPPRLNAHPALHHDGIGAAAAAPSAAELQVLQRPIALPASTMACRSAAPPPVSEQLPRG